MTATETKQTATQTFKILAADKLAPEGLKFIEDQSDAELVNKPGLPEEELAKIVGEHDAMIVRSGVKVTAKVLENPGRLRVIARAGYDVEMLQARLQRTQQQLEAAQQRLEAKRLNPEDQLETSYRSMLRKAGRDTNKK